jgi:hypothetical protein
MKMRGMARPVAPVTDGIEPAEGSAPHHQGIDNLIAFKVLAKTEHRAITAPLHRQPLRLIRSNRLSLHEQELTLLTLGVRYHHRGTVVGPADHEGLTSGGLAAAPGHTRNLRRSVVRSAGDQGIAGSGHRGEGSTADAHLQAVGARFVAARSRPHQVHPHPHVAIAGQETTEAVAGAAADKQGGVGPGRHHIEVVLRIGPLDLHRQGLTGAGPQFVVDGLVALELALEQGGIGAGSKRDPLTLDRHLGQGAPSGEADGQEASAQ